MRKKSSILLAGLLALSAGSAKADEGMWTLYNLPQAVYEQMKTYGFNLPYDALYSGDLTPDYLYMGAKLPENNGYIRGSLNVAMV